MSKHAKPKSGGRSSGRIMRDDPLAWLTDEPQTAAAQSPEAAAAPETPQMAQAGDAAADSQTTDPQAAEGWGLFDAEPSVDTPAVAVVQDQTIAAADDRAPADQHGEGWGLFDAAEPAAEDAAGEGWGLFAADADAQVAAAQQGEQDADGSWGLFAAPQDAQRIKLGSSLLFTDVASCHQQLLAAAERGSVSVDGGAVERIDAAGLQLLCALQRSEQHNGRSLHWAQASAVLCDGAAGLGLSGELGLPAELGVCADRAAAGAVA